VNQDESTQIVSERVLGPFMLQLSKHENRFSAAC
jgi:hypothetical protein